jgi:hypothetical protein
MRLNLSPEAEWWEREADLILALFREKRPEYTLAVAKM